MEQPDFRSTLFAIPLASFRHIIASKIYHGNGLDVPIFLFFTVNIDLLYKNLFGKMHN